MRPAATASREAGSPAGEPAEGAAPPPRRACDRLPRPRPICRQGAGGRRVLCPEPRVYGALLYAPRAEIPPFRGNRGLPPALIASPQPPRVSPKRLPGLSEAVFSSGKPAQLQRRREAGRHVCAGRIRSANRFLRLLPPSRPPSPPPPITPPLPLAEGQQPEPDPGIYSPPECRHSSCSNRWFHALPFSQSLTLWSQPARCNHPALLPASDGQQEKSPKARPSRKAALRRGGGLLKSPL